MATAAQPVTGKLERTPQTLRHFHIAEAGDLRHFAQGTSRPIPSCMYGPGRGRGAYVANEYVETEDLLRVAQNVASFVLEWCEAADGPR